MAFIFDKSTGIITMMTGDTAELRVRINWHKLAPGDAMVFGIYDPNSAEDIFRKPAEIQDGMAVIRLCNADTRDLEPSKKYTWQLRIVTSPARDESGNIIADDCGDDVISVFQNPPRFILMRGGAYV